MVAAFLAALALQGTPPSVELKTATRHPMQYYISLPEGWSAKKKWPVVVCITGAERDFEDAANRFANARKHLPFIVVVPMVVTNGGPGYRNAPTYHYPPSTWKEIDRVGEYGFDLEGVEAAVADVKNIYSGEPKFYLSAFEAGCHTLFALTFRHPDWLLASAPNSPNYQGRGLDEGSFSRSPARRILPIHEIHGSDDPFCAPDKPFFTQWRTAESVARSHGFENISNQVVRGKGHEWLIDEALEYFARLQH